MHHSTRRISMSAFYVLCIMYHALWLTIEIELNFDSVENRLDCVTEKQ